MIEIREIIENSRFPIVEFTFRNRGRGTAVLSQFCVHIDSIETDMCPSIKAFLSIKADGTNTNPERGRFDFDSVVESGRLAVTIRNDGWGSAHDIESIVSAPLCDLFPASKSAKIDKLASGATKEMFVFSHQNLDANIFDTVLRRFATVKNKYGDTQDLARAKDESLIDAFTIETVSLKLGYKDANGFTHQETVRASTDWLSGNFGGSLWILKGCFRWHGRFVCFDILSPSAIYYVSLDAEGQITHREYAIAHKIGPGDVEHFAIMVGSERSSIATIWVEFKIDNNQIIGSEKFTVKIWNPRNEKYHRRYVNGDELISARLRAGSSALDRVPWLEREFQQSAFPFLSRADRGEAL